MLYIKLFIEREKNTGQSAPECPFNAAGCALAMGFKYLQTAVSVTVAGSSEFTVFFLDLFYEL